MKWGLENRLPIREFWKTLQLPGEWIEGDLEELLKAKLDGVFVDPAMGDELIPRCHQVPRGVVETHFIDLVKANGNRLAAFNHARGGGSEFLSHGQPSLNTRMRAYITGVGPWARLFALIAIEKGFSDIQIVVSKTSEAEVMAQDLRRYCFGVSITPLRHADLTLQPNNGSLLVNTIDPTSSPEIMEDLAYLNYLSPGSLVVEIDEEAAIHPLIEESKHSNLPFVDGAATRAFFEYRALSATGDVLSFGEYAKRRQEWRATLRNSPSV